MEISGAVSLESSVVIKIMQHCSDVPGWTIGHLIGLETQDCLEVSNCFAMPSGSQKTPSDVEGYNTEMLEHFRVLGFKGTLLGWYQKVEDGCFFDINSIEYQFSMQTDLPSAIMLVYDSRASDKGQYPLSAYRLSANFMKFYQEGEYSIQKSRDLQIDAGSVFVEIELSVHQNLLSTAFVLQYGPYGHHTQVNPLRYLSQDLKTLSQTVKEVTDKQIEYQKMIEDIQKQKVQAAAFEQQRNDENRLRTERGEAPLPMMEGSGSIYRAIVQPSRLEQVVLIAQILQLARTVNDDVVRAYEVLSHDKE